MVQVDAEHVMEAAIVNMVMVNVLNVKVIKFVQYVMGKNSIVQIIQNVLNAMVVKYVKLVMVLVLVVKNV